MEASGGNYGDNDSFEVSPDDSVAEEQRFESTNVCRVAALSTILGNDAEAVGDLKQELQALGFGDWLHSGEGIPGDFRSPEAFAVLSSMREPGQSETRVSRWIELLETYRDESAVSFLVAVLVSKLERESAAAAALWRLTAHIDWQTPHGDPGPWLYWNILSGIEWPELTDPWWPLPWGRGGPPDAPTEDLVVVPWDQAWWGATCDQTIRYFGFDGAELNAALVRLLASFRLELALRSPDQITRSLAMATFFGREDDPDVEAHSPRQRAAAPRAPTVSTMIHGTWAWMGDWWRPPGGFHQFILCNDRPDLYSGGARFSWSGLYRASHRRQAVAYFREWADDRAPGGLNTVFAHSYGGDIAARAATGGVRLNELVLLSAPATRSVRAAVDSGLRVVDVRLRFDSVLALARRRQRIRNQPPNVTEVLLKRWRLHHGASHDPNVWVDENVAVRGGI